MKKKLVKNTIGPDRYKHSRSFEIQSLEIVKVVVLILFVLVGRRVGGRGGVVSTISDFML